MALVLLAAGRMPDVPDNEEDSKAGWVTLTSKHGLDDTVKKLTAVARSRGMSVLAKVAPQRAGIPQDVQAEAPALVLVLGNHEGHTPVVQDGSNASPHLPMKVLVETRRDGSTAVSFHDGATLLSDASVPSEFIGGVKQLARVVGAAVG